MIRAMNPAGDARRGLRGRARRALLRALGAGFGALLLALSACGPTPTARYAVVERGLSLVDAGPGDEDRPSQGRRYELTAGGAWSLGPLQTVSESGLQAEGDGALDLVGPGDASFDPSLHHHLRVRVNMAGTIALRLQWRSAGEPWTPQRESTAMRIPSTTDWQNFQFELDQMRGNSGGRDVVEGADEFRLLFLPATPRGHQTVEVGLIEFVSDFDAEGLALQRVERLGTYLDGQALPAPGTYELALNPGQRDRLRFCLASLGAAQQLRVSDAEGRLAPVTYALHPGEPWRDLKLDLSPLGGQPSTLRFELAGEGGGLVLIGALMRLAPEAAPRPDLVLYLEDTLRADRLGTYGYALPTDPALQALAAQGVVLETTYAASSWTRPSLSSVFSSQHPGRHGNRTHLDMLSDEVTTLAETLAEAGWLTRSFVTNYHGGQWAGLDQGFDHAGDATAYGASSLHDTLTSELVAEPIERFLAEHADERVFVHVHTLDPHAPYEAPAELRGEFLRGRRQRGERFTGPDAERLANESIQYDAEILHNDRRLARLDAALAARGRVADTLLVFLSDHGEAWQEHGQLEHRESLHEEEVRVPWVLRWPGGLPAGRRLDAPVSHVDVAPTLAGLLGVAPGEGWQGRDLSGWLGGTASGPPEPDRPILLDLIYEAPRGELRGELAVVHAGLKLVADLLPEDELRPRALYDLAADPEERHDLSADPDRADAQQSLIDWARERMREDREQRSSQRAAPMTAEQCESLRALGYIDGDC